MSVLPHRASWLWGLSVPHASQLIPSCGWEAGIAQEWKPARSYLISHERNFNSESTSTVWGEAHTMIRSKLESIKCELLTAHIEHLRRAWQRGGAGVPFVVQWCVSAQRSRRRSCGCENGTQEGCVGCVTRDVWRKPWVGWGPLTALSGEAAPWLAPLEILMEQEALCS